ncbi:MAG: Smr/MutS family protein [Bacilli bacterium]|jgi:DNA mismatch repair protein MutS2
MPDIYEVLEFIEIRQMISTYAQSDIGRESSLSLEMLNKENLGGELAILDEMMVLNIRYGHLPMMSSSNLTRKVEYALKGGTLTAEDLEAVAHDVIITAKITESIRKREEKFPLLNNKVRLFQTLEQLEKSIHRVVGPDLGILSSASSTLNSIRKSIAETERKMNLRFQLAIDSLRDYMNEPVATIRNGHFVLPIKTIFKGKVSGVIHDISDTGMTTFIEPDWAVESNNQIYILKIEEREEIQRLLKELSILVARFSAEILTNNALIGYLDFLQSKALYGMATDAKIAELSEQRTIDIKKARHPLIDPKAVVANDFVFDEKTRIIVISGPNAGGKTVAIKTLGLMIIMNQCGLAIPTANHAKVSYFSHIFADIGDSQSLASNLSTFSGHIKNLAEIADQVSVEDLVLLDEIGTGTSPLEGEALAIAYLDYLRRVGSFVFCSSHYDGLKDYALNTDCIINASVLFDEQKMTPTYVLKRGVPGRSYGLEMADRYNLSKSIISSANDILKKQGHDQSISALGNLQKLISESEAKTQLLDAEIKKVANLEKSLLEREQKLENQRLHLLEDVEESKRETIAKTELEIEGIMQVLKNPNLKMHEVIEAKRKLKELDDDEVEISTSETGEISAGDYVSIIEMGILGRVERVSGDKVFIISSDGLKFTSSKNRVRIIDAPRHQSVEKPFTAPNITSDVKLELNVIGLHVDEALEELSRYLDGVRLKRFSQVRIIHGFGTGALKRAIHEYLKKCDFIESFRPGDQHEGAGGATVVKLK